MQAATAARLVDELERRERILAEVAEALRGARAVPAGCWESNGARVEKRVTYNGRWAVSVGGAPEAARALAERLVSLHERLSQARSRARHLRALASRLERVGLQVPSELRSTLGELERLIGELEAEDRSLACRQPDSEKPSVSSSNGRVTVRHGRLTVEFPADRIIAVERNGDTVTYYLEGGIDVVISRDGVEVIRG